MPSLNWVLARVTDGPCNDSGPSDSVLDPAAAVCSEPEMVKISSLRVPATALSPLPTCQLPATTCTLTSPATNMSFASTPVLVVSR